MITAAVTLFPSFCSASIRVWLAFFRVPPGHKTAIGAPASHLHSGRKKEKVVKEKMAFIN